MVSESFNAATGSRHIRYGYGELTIPIAGKDTRRPGLEELLITLAGRYENYSDTDHHFSPLVGLSYKPVSNVRLRGTWNESFHAPSLFQKYSPYYVFTNFPVEAAPPNPGTTNALIALEGNKALRPETARTFTLGFDWKPEAHPQLVLNGTYFNIVYSNRITQPLDDLTAALVDPVYAPLVTLNPSASQQQALLSGAGGVYNITGMPYDPSTTGAIIDDRYLNVSHQTARGFDLRASFSKETTIGSFMPSLNGSYLQLRQKLLSASPEETISGLVFYPPKYKIQAILTWTRGPFGATGIMNYVPGAENNLVTPSTHIESWPTLDLQGSYTLSRDGHWLDGLSVRVSLQNAFDRQPPYVHGALLGYDNTQASPLGRVLRLALAKKW
jgi:outer membrane receptor protein involved in Fe transport